MATKRPTGSHAERPQPQKPQRAQGLQGAQKLHGRESTALRDLGPDTVWQTRGRHGHTRLRASRPSPVRTPRPQLPPSRVPRLLLWGLLLVLLAVLANAVMNMTH